MRSARRIIILDALVILAIPATVVGLVWAAMAPGEPARTCGIGGVCNVCSSPHLGPTWERFEPVAP